MKFIFYYTDGSEVILRFADEEAAARYARLEGDHLIDWKKCE